MILFGHPTGNPNSHHAALAHYERGRLEAFCVPWMPTLEQIESLGRLPGLRGWAARLRRRYFSPLQNAPRIEGKTGEWLRMASRVAFPLWVDERLSYQANDWLMRTMSRECRRETVSAVHCYEDCSLWQFEEAKRRGKLCIYDMPIGYYPAWEDRQKQLARDYEDWLPPEGLPANRYVRPAQKRREMELADLIIAPSTFVHRTIREFTDKQVAWAPYGVDLEFWNFAEEKQKSHSLRFIYAGQCSLRKGIHLLLKAWQLADLKDATLELVGLWQLSDRKRQELPANVRWISPLSREGLRARYQASDVFVFPSYFEGFGLVLLEAMACGLPAIATTATAGPDVLDEETGRIVKHGDLEALIESLRWFSKNREQVPMMARAARGRSEQFTWERYRRCVADAVAPFAEKYGFIPR